VRKQTGRAVLPEFDLSCFMLAEREAPMNARDFIANAWRAYLDDLMARTRGNVRNAAALAGVNRTALYGMLAQSGVPFGAALRGEAERAERRRTRCGNRGNRAWRELGR
jgi:hypothetical protein